MRGIDDQDDNSMDAVMYYHTCMTLQCSMDINYNYCTSIVSTVGQMVSTLVSLFLH